MLPFARNLYIRAHRAEHYLVHGGYLSLFSSDSSIVDEKRTANRSLNCSNRCRRHNLQNISLQKVFIM